MKKVIVLILPACLLLGMIGQAFSNGKADQTEGFNIVIAPQALLLSADQSGTVTVHTNIAYGAVDLATIKLDDIPVSWTKRDSLGHLVAKFSEDAVKAAVVPPEATLTLSLDDKDGVYYSDADTVRVMP